jgi:hypothetical protein
MMKQWLLLENNPALLRHDFFPPPDVWPELAPLRAEHERLLTVASSERHAYAEAQRKHEAEDAARGTELTAAFLAGGIPGDDARPSEETRTDELADARLRAESAYDALTAFLGEALAEIQARAADWYEQLEPRHAEAQAKRDEAARLLAEADAQVAEVRRFSSWLDRESGRSALGHHPYSDMPASAEPPTVLTQVA